MKRMGSNLLGRSERVFMRPPQTRALDYANGCLRGRGFLRLLCHASSNQLFGRVKTTTRKHPVRLPTFGPYIDKFPKCRPLISYLQGPDVNVERELEKWQNKANDKPERFSQLAAIRYYLQDMLSACTFSWLQEI